MKWIAFAESFPKDSKACYGVLNELNADLAQKSILLGNGFTPSEADVIVFSAIHSSVVCIFYVYIFKLLVCFEERDLGAKLLFYLMKKICCNSIVR